MSWKNRGNLIAYKSHLRHLLRSLRTKIHPHHLRQCFEKLIFTIEINTYGNIFFINETLF